MRSDCNRLRSVVEFEIRLSRFRLEGLLVSTLGRNCSFSGGLFSATCSESGQDNLFWSIYILEMLSALLFPVSFNVTNTNLTKTLE